MAVKSIRYNSEYQIGRDISNLEIKLAALEKIIGQDVNMLELRIDQLEQFVQNLQNSNELKKIIVG